MEISGRKGWERRRDIGGTRVREGSRRRLSTPNKNHAYGPGCGPILQTQIMINVKH